MNDSAISFISLVLKKVLLSIFVFTGFNNSFQ